MANHQTHHEKLTNNPEYKSLIEKARVVTWALLVGVLFFALYQARG